MTAKRLSVLATVLLAAVLALPRPAISCSSLVLLVRGVPVFGTNYDNEFAPGHLFINKRGVRRSGWQAGTTGRVAEWVSRYGSVTISCAGYQLAWGGMNEAGLVFSTMLLGGTRPPAPDERPLLAGDITAAFHVYSHAEAEAHIVKALACFRPNLPRDMVKQVLALFESFSCEPAKK